MRHESPEAVRSMTAPSEASPRSSNRQSDPERLDFQWELFSAIAREMLPLLRRQHGELGINKDSVPFDPDWDRYFQYERGGYLRIWTARANGVLVGYVNCFLTNSLLCRSVLHGYAEHFWLAPEWRSGRGGLDFLRSAERGMADLGAKVVRFNTNDAYEPDRCGRSRVGVALRRIGYAPIVTIWERVL